MNIELSVLLLKLSIALFIAWQDFNYRGVYWFLFPVLLLLEIATHIISILPTDLYLLNAILNCSLILIQVVVLFFYFKVVRKITNLFEHAFGLGDLLMLFCFAFAFPFAGFIIFCLSTFLISISITLLAKLAKKDISASIPLAGIQAATYCILLLVNQLYVLPLFSLNYWMFNFVC